MTADTSTPPELVWLFDAALCMWAVLELGEMHDGDLAVSISWTATPALDAWIENGAGAVAIQGLGRVPGLAAESVLQAAADRLEVISWGLAARYRRVLLGLISQEGQETQAPRRDSS